MRRLIDEMEYLEGDAWLLITQQVLADKIADSHEFAHLQAG